MKSGSSGYRNNSDAPYFHRRRNHNQESRVSHALASASCFFLKKRQSTFFHKKNTDTEMPVAAGTCASSAAPFAHSFIHVSKRSTLLKLYAETLSQDCSSNSGHAFHRSLAFIHKKNIGGLSYE
jgi:hypothetical protein